MEESKKNDSSSDKKAVVPHHLGAFVGKSLKKKTEIHFETGIPRGRLSNILDSKVDTMTMEEFYLIGLSLDADLDEMSEETFKDYVIKDDELISSEKTYKTNYDKYLSSVLINQKVLSEKTGLTEFRISQLRNNEKASPLAHEIHRTVKALKGKLSEAYSILCGHITLKSPQEQEELREKYKGDLAIQKAKREAKEFTKSLIDYGFFNDNKRTEEDIVAEAKLKLGEGYDLSYIPFALNGFVDKEKLLVKETVDNVVYYSEIK
ncbi:hypothetical protein [Olivibacter sitiensis]|uniref:hypothetical protein n=1 Tax=Olivibacter sitiensis TaxID=376470 RepID=UPI0003FF6122|nr:hypothetical protein [Olivibacter sitiensis]